MGMKGGIKNQEKDDNIARLVKENDALKAEIKSLKNISDKYTRSIMENSALRAEMKRKDEEIKRLKILLLEVQSCQRCKKINLNFTQK